MAIARNISINDETYELEPSKGQRVYVGTCSTGAATNPKVCTVETFPVDGNGEPYVGTEIVVKFTATNSSTSTTPQLNVNGTGAIRIWYNNAVLASAKSAFAGYANRYMRYVYDGTYWVFMGHSVDNNSTYSNVALGQGYAVQNNSAASATITATLGSYALTANGIVSVKFTYDVPANATLNINGNGAKAIYNKDAAITSNVIKAGDTATFIYNTYYRLISVDRWQDKQDAISDLATIRSGATLGATALQQNDVSVETQGDGTVDIKVKDDIYSINLNHTHEGMSKLVVCEESDLPSTLDNSTIYAITDSGETEIEKLVIRGLEFAGGGGSSVEPTLPTGYVECEYVQSSDPTIIVTGIAPVGSKWMLDLEASPTSGNQVFICSKTDGGLFAAVNSGGNFALGANNVLSSAAIRSEVWIEFITDGTIMKIGSDSTQRVNTSSPVQHHGSYVNLLGFNNNYKYVGKIYRIRCTKGGYFNGVPAREVSSGDYGIYDLANGTFITGNFTGVVKQ